MTALEQELTQNLAQMQAMQKQMLEEYENSLKQIVEDLGQSYKKHMNIEQDKKMREDESLLMYFKELTEQNREIIRLLKTPSQADGVAMQLQPILREFFQNLETRLISSNQGLIEEIENSLERLKRPS